MTTTLIQGAFDVLQWGPSWATGHDPDSLRRWFAISFVASSFFILFGLSKANFYFMLLVLANCSDRAHTGGQAGAGATRRVPLSVKRIKTVQKKRRNCRWLDAFRFFYCCIVLIPEADGRPIAYLIYLAISWFISHDDARSTRLDVSFSSSFF